MSADSPWKMTTASVISSEFHYARLADLSPESEPFVDKSFYVVRFRYNVNGEEFTGTLELYEPLTPGEQLSISYDPANPAENSTYARKYSIGTRAMIWVVGLALTALLIHLWNKAGLPLD